MRDRLVNGKVLGVTHRLRLHRFLFLILCCVVAGLMLPLPASAQSLKVTLLGTGDPDPLMERFGPNILVEAGNEKLIFDAGRGGMQRLAQLGIPWNDLSALFLTHLHSDHTVGIPDLYLTGWLLGREVPFRVWGPAGTRAMMSHLVKAFQFDIHIRQADDLRPAEGAVVLAKDIAQGVVYENGGVKVTAFDVEHGPVKPALGYRIDVAGHSVVLSGDTNFSENLIRFAQGADVLIHEVCLADPEVLKGSEHERHVMAHHITPERAAEVFNRVQPKLAVYSHIVLLGNVNEEQILARTRKTYSGPLDMGEDLMVITIGEQIKVSRADTAHPDKP